MYFLNYSNYFRSTNISIRSGNKCFYNLTKILRLRAQSREIQIQLYITLLRSMITYETWALRKTEEKKMNVS